MNASIQQTRDEWIALQCQHGEPGAFADLVREMERPLLYFAQKLVAEQQTDETEENRAASGDRRQRLRCVVRFFLDVQRRHGAAERGADGSQ
jgi:hypothetical protein